MYRFLAFHLFYFFSFLAFSQNLQTPFELSKGTQTATYQEGIGFYEQLDKQYEEIKLLQYGTSDAGFPLHLAVYSADGDFEPSSLKQKGRNIFLVINAIHAGEPDGVDASMMLLRDIVTDNSLKKICKNTVIAVIPFYSVGGVLQRNSVGRANQNGPASYGFRGNARNYDLNRDFTKLDTENAKTFVQIFQTWQPDVQIDNHVSNGADYQYTMTYIFPNLAELNPEIAAYFKKEFQPDLKNLMKKKNEEITPYVETKDETPDGGLIQDFSSPRFSNGYATLFHTLAFVAETHMLKSFDKRVEATYKLMQSILEILDKDGAKIRKNRKKAFEYDQKEKSFVLDWKIDFSKSEMIDFKGYEASYISSKVTNGKRLFYDKQKPYNKKIPFYNVYQEKLRLEKPKMYIIPKLYSHIAKILEMNGVKVSKIQKNDTFKGFYYYIKNYQTSQKPYEGHYPHQNTEVEKRAATYEVTDGDWIVMGNQAHIRFIMSVLEPQAPDSYFNWNYFDILLQQKEYYSAYVFEEIAEKILKENPTIKANLQEKIQKEAEFAKNPKAQLDYIYYQSPHYEKHHLRYPIFRVE
ncbi:MAG: M14 family zinc carboxypeptidase [Thermonemataceae bacterium]|nr:M14 family zinc carboxypeptidase [Thermonemataceae bacterium]